MTDVVTGKEKLIAAIQKMYPDAKIEIEEAFYNDKKGAHRIMFDGEYSYGIWQDDLFNDLSTFSNGNDVLNEMVDLYTSRLALWRFSIENQHRKDEILDNAKKEGVNSWETAETKAYIEEKMSLIN